MLGHVSFGQFLISVCFKHSRSEVSMRRRLDLRHLSHLPRWPSRHPYVVARMLLESMTIGDLFRIDAKLLYQDV